MRKYWFAIAICLSFATLASAQEYDFKRNLSFGSRGQDVVALQTFLEAKGHLSIPRGIPKGFFGVRTLAALKKYQQSERITPPNGYLGPITREKIKGGNSIASSTPITTPKVKGPITLISPNGGESLTIGTKSNVQWTTTSTSTSPKISIYLKSNISGCFNLQPGQACLTVVDPEFIIASNIQNSGSFQWTVGSTTVATDSLYRADAATVQSDYYMVVCKGTEKPNTGACDTSDATFKLKK